MGLSVHFNLHSSHRQASGSRPRMQITQEVGGTCAPPPRQVPGQRPWHRPHLQRETEACRGSPLTPSHGLDASLSPGLQQEDGLLRWPLRAEALQPAAEPTPRTVLPDLPEGARVSTAAQGLPLRGPGEGREGPHRPLKLLWAGGDSRWPAPARAGGTVTVPRQESSPESGVRAADTAGQRVLPEVLGTAGGAAPRGLGGRGEDEGMQAGGTSLARHRPVVSPGLAQPGLVTMPLCARRVWTLGHCPLQGLPPPPPPSSVAPEQGTSQRAGAL